MESRLPVIRFRLLFSVLHQVDALQVSTDLVHAPTVLLERFRHLLLQLPRLRVRNAVQERGQVRARHRANSALLVHGRPPAAQRHLMYVLTATLEHGPQSLG
jgi:hypothetical protein